MLLIFIPIPNCKRSDSSLYRDTDIFVGMLPSISFKLISICSPFKYLHCTLVVREHFLEFCGLLIHESVMGRDHRSQIFLKKIDPPKPTSQMNTLLNVTL